MQMVMKQRMMEDTMDENVRKLRFDFEAETDIDIDESSENWQEYAQWLEKLSVSKLNNEMVKENDALRNMMNEAMGLLEEGVVSRIE